LSLRVLPQEEEIDWAKWKLKTRFFFRQKKRKVSCSQSSSHESEPDSDVKEEKEKPEKKQKTQKQKTFGEHLFLGGLGHGSLKVLLSCRHARFESKLFQVSSPNLATVAIQWPVWLPQAPHHDLK